MSEKTPMDVFDAMVDRVLSYRPKTKRKKKAKRKAPGTKKAAKEA